jgi:class 3 adenylate cyclase
MSAQVPMTILFADISGSTKLFESRGDVAARSITSAILAALGEIAVRHAGRVIKHIGDEIMCTFPGAMNALQAAIEMQRRVAADAAWQRDRLAMRIGLNHGEALEEDGDVYGDAVNLAARVADHAKREQIVTTLASVQAVNAMGTFKTRNLGQIRVAGKQHPIDIVDVIWQEDTSNVTMVARAIRLDAPGTMHKLVMRSRGQVIELNEMSPPFGLGRDPGNNLVVDNEWVSRNHAIIEFQRGFFTLTDRSTNGTYVRLGDDDELRLHRDTIQLRKSGSISLGQSVDRDPDNVVYFQCSG